MSIAKLIFGAVLGISLVAVAPAVFPGESAVAQEISDSHLAAARRAITASRSTNQLDLILPRMSQNVKSELIRNLPNEELRISTIVDEAALEVAGRRGDLEIEAARIFARIFSEEELIVVAEFYETEAGQKFLERSPLVLREIQRASQVWRNGVRRDMTAIVQQKLEEAGLR